MGKCVLPSGWGAGQLFSSSFLVSSLKIPQQLWPREDQTQSKWWPTWLSNDQIMHVWIKCEFQLSGDSIYSFTEFYNMSSFLWAGADHLVEVVDCAADMDSHGSSSVITLGKHANAYPPTLHTPISLSLCQSSQLISSLLAQKNRVKVMLLLPLPPFYTQWQTNVFL